MTPPVPFGFRLAGVHCGIKAAAEKEDLSLILCDREMVAAGTYTQNVVRAPAVHWNESRTPGDDLRAVVVNSGNANTCTGQQGRDDCRQMAAWAAQACGVGEEQTLVMSTGIIGVPLPMEKVRAGIQAAGARLADDHDALASAARGMLTTDTVTKIAARLLEIEGTAVRLIGLAKGSGMIAPNMATMLAVIMTDAALTPESAQSILSPAVQHSFNSISVDGHMSTSDTVLLLASGAAVATPLSGSDQSKLSRAVEEICEELAKAIVIDGEGASHLITIGVKGCRATKDARAIARTIANSPLVKTAIAGADPNWGRIVSAAGYAGVPFDPDRVRLQINGTLLFDAGAPAAFDAAAVSASIRDEHETSILLELTDGDAEARFWTCDLTGEYVRINADYHT